MPAVRTLALLTWFGYAFSCVYEIGKQHSHSEMAIKSFPVDTASWFKRIFTNISNILIEIQPNATEADLRKYEQKLIDLFGKVLNDRNEIRQEKIYEEESIEATLYEEE